MSKKSYVEWLTAHVNFGTAVVRWATALILLALAVLTYLHFKGSSNGDTTPADSDQDSGRVSASKFPSFLREEEEPSVESSRIISENILTGTREILSVPAKQDSVISVAFPKVDVKTAQIVLSASDTAEEVESLLVNKEGENPLAEELNMDLFRVPDTATYKLAISDAQSGQRMVVRSHDPPPGGTISGDTLIRGSIDSLGDVDLHTLSVRGDDQVLLFLQTLDEGDVRIGMEVFQEGRAQKSASVHSSGFGRTQASAFGTGRLVLVVFGKADSFPLSYELGVKRLEPMVILENGSRYVEEGDIAFVGDVRIYELKSEPGARWRIEQVCKGDLQTNTKIVDAAGSVLASVICSEGSPVVRPVVGKGPFWITIREAKGTTGSFSLTVEQTDRLNRAPVGSP